MLAIIGVTILVWLTASNGRATANSAIDFFPAAKEMFEKKAVNCTESIQPHWRELMQKSVHYKNGGFTLVKSLSECLHGKLIHVNETAPFPLVENPLILYDIMLNQVVSLGFDGTLITKVLYFLY